MDLTKITTPFGLLDKETQDALKVWPHGVECFEYSGWEAVHWPTWASQLTYRAHPAPREPREIWHLLDLNGEVYDTFTSFDDAKRENAQRARFTLVHYREVMHDAQHRHNDAAMLQSAAAMIPEE